MDTFGTQRTSGHPDFRDKCLVCINSGTPRCRDLLIKICPGFKVSVHGDQWSKGLHLCTFLSSDMLNLSTIVPVLNPSTDRPSVLSVLIRTFTGDGVLSPLKLSVDKVFNGVLLDEESRCLNFLAVIMSLRASRLAVALLTQLSVTWRFMQLLLAGLRVVIQSSLDLVERLSSLLVVGLRSTSWYSTGPAAESLPEDSVSAAMREKGFLLCGLQVLP